MYCDDDQHIENPFCSIEDTEGHCVLNEDVEEEDEVFCCCSGT